MKELHANPEDFDLYALGALDGEEKQSFETHLDACATCRQELAQAKQRAVLLGLAVPPLAPPASVKSALMQKVHGDRAAADKHSAPRQTQKARWGLRFSLAFAAAAVILALAVSGLWRLNTQRQRENAQLRAQLDAARAQVARDRAAMQAMGQVTGAPDSAQITLLQQPGGPPGQAHVLYNARMGLAIYSGQIAPPPPGKSYQLWLVPASGVPVNAGLVSPNQEEGADVVRLTQGLAAKAFAVTMEPLGGRPQPTGPKVLVGAVGA